ncbi:MAG: PAS domain-containing sensor histidine kinase [Acidobacteria bacterium]|nr:MAG: PAS domain-containing sensor histidine kinase [Acidobacteriota bacterium]REK06381.1 MAG: PAS domain-containing sensor histidine kinase [Acidobacteriota bacterium]
MRRVRRIALSLRVLLPAVVLVLGLVIVLFATASERIDSRHRAVRRAVEDLATTKSFVSNEIETALRRDDEDKLRSTIEAIPRHRDIVAALLVDPGGRIVFATQYQLEGRSLGETRFARWQEAVGRSARQNISVRVEDEERDHLIDISPLSWLLEPGELLASRRGVLIIEYDLQAAFVDTVDDARRRLLVLIAIVVLATVATMVLLHELVLVRLDEVARYAAAGPTGPPLPPARGVLSDEISQIRVAFSEAQAEARRRLLALQVSEQRFRNIVEGSSDWVFETNSDGAITFTNHGCLRVVGLPADAVLGRRLTSFFLPTHHEVLPPNCPTERREHAELELAGGEGRRFVRLVLQPAGGKGAPRAYHGVCTDITESRRLQQMQRQSQKLELVGQLAGGVAHDYNNLVAVMLGHCELLLLDGELTESQRESVEEILECCQRSAELTRRLLAFGRRQVVEPRLVDLRDVVLDAGRFLRRLVASNVRLSCSCGDEPLWVRADPAQLEQVIINLVINARDAMPDGGAVEISCRRPVSPETGHDDSPGALAQIEVRDEGCGMDEATLERVFEPFFTTKPSGKGTGLGLSTALGIVEQAGGTMSVQSRVGEGTRVTVTLPLSPEAPASLIAVGTAFVPPATGNEEILVVDDREDLLGLIGTALSGIGYRVRKASSSEQALEEVAASLPDLALVDVMLAEGTGIELGRRLHERWPQLPVVYMSGYAAQLEREGRLQAGVNYLCKPFTLAELAGFVRGALDGRQTDAERRRESSTDPATASP